MSAVNLSVYLLVLLILIGLCYRFCVSLFVRELKHFRRPKSQFAIYSSYHSDPVDIPLSDWSVEL